jgi:hypothetical protein
LPEVGYYRLRRSLLTSPFFRSGGARGEIEAWAWLVAAAAVRPGDGTFGRPVNRGEIDLNIRGLMQQWGWTERHVEGFLQRLEAAGFIAATEERICIVGFDEMTAPANDEPTGAGVEILSAFDLICIGYVDHTLKRPAIPAAVRREVEARDGQHCRYCEDDGGPFHLDHVLPWSSGGRSTPANLVVACEPCNLSKGDRTPEEWRAASS